MNKIRKQKFLSSYLPLLLTLLLVFAAGWFVMAHWSQAPSAPLPRLVIDPGAPLTKDVDQIGQVEIGAKTVVQIRFSWQQDGYRYNDALVLTPAEYAKLTSAQIQGMEQARFENWVKTVNRGSAVETLQ